MRAFSPNQIAPLFTSDFTSPPKKLSGLLRLTPSLLFYSKVLTGPLFWLYHMARKNQCTDAAWCWGSQWFIQILQNLGTPIHIEGLKWLQEQKEPCVIVANHMSTLETFFLPGLIRPYFPVTFVVKESLVRMPFFGPIMRSRNPIVVMRKNPREDLATVLEQGVLRLKSGISVIIFPQSTRMLTFEPQKFNSIGEKLAKKANVPLLPLALKTDAWRPGVHIRDLGPFEPGKPIYFRFAAPFTVSGPSKTYHQQILSFITASLATWS
ncbi:MAG: 1-acyl-sn-glycerol-3-phosphate acyltransferase [Desulfovibrio sp.]|nr:1-acyl-sn-glycerol-3-phosphate acyltransferase [Desulfovibrio sp.]